MVKVLALATLAGIASLALAAIPSTAIELKARRNTISTRDLLKRDDTDPSLLYATYNISVPIDHFHNDTLYEPHSNDTFALRYWFDATYYKPGGPVIVLQGGETDGIGRLGFLQKGLLHKLAVATHGVGVVLEHRYYGGSWPTSDLSNESLRFLTTDQALADQAYFSQHVVFEGLEQYNLTAPSAAHIAYGGSYAGAFVAFLRKLYPDVYWGAISSSGVTEAIYDYWAYFEPIKTYAPQTCVSYVQKITHMVDNLLIGLNETATTEELKGVFGLPNVTYDNDFAYGIARGVTSWQGKNWDPELNDPDFDLFCTNISTASVIYPETASLKSTTEDLLTKGGYGSELGTLTTAMLNWIGWLAKLHVTKCAGEQDTCFGTHNSTYYAQDDISQDWRSWPYQYCTQWGYLATGSGVPANELPLISRTNDIAYNSIICEEAFNITTPANVTAINKFGGFGISYPRLAFIDGEWDPWRPATPHAFPFNITAHDRKSTIDEPFIMIPEAVHHWDENGLFFNQTVTTIDELMPPAAIRVVQAEEIEFVMAWMLEWDAKFGVKPEL